jgi:hypothetical protein
MDIERRKQMLARYGEGIATIHAALEGVTDAELDRRPAPDAWTAREIVHHLADSETNSFIRLRRLVAEDDPVIIGYDEQLWAARLHYERPIESPLATLAAVRAASLDLALSLTEAEWQRSGTHTESGPYSIERWLEIYCQHPQDHAEQIRRARVGRT